METAALGGAGYSPSQDSLPYSISGGTFRGYIPGCRSQIDITQYVLRPILRRMRGSCRDRPRALGIGAAAYIVSSFVYAMYMECTWSHTNSSGGGGDGEDEDTRQEEARGEGEGEDPGERSGHRASTRTPVCIALFRTLGAVISMRFSHREAYGRNCFISQRYRQ